MDELRENLSREFPEQTPIRRSRYIPDCLIGRSKVWKSGRETITDTHQLYPDGALQGYIRGQESSVESSLTSRIWSTMSRITMLTVGLGSKLVTAGINTLRVHGREHLETALSRSTGVPLLSMFNHNSCFDDPGLMGGILSVAQLADKQGMRWGISATEVIFVNRFLSTFWALGKVVPVMRGWGPRQPALDFLIDRLNEGSWVNIFPEAKVNDTQCEERYKWGVGRLVAESKKSPIILPVYHVGMNRILPNPKAGESQPFLIRPGNLVTVCIGEPIDMSVERELLNNENPEESWSRITRELEKVMRELEKKTVALHRVNLVVWLKRWHDTRDVYSYLLT